MKQLLTIAVILLTSFSFLYSGNLNFKATHFPLTVEYESEEEVEVEYENINLNFSVTNIKFFMSVYAIGSSNLIYQTQVEEDELLADSDIKINFGTLDYNKLDAGLSYRLEFNTEQDFDEDPSNNFGSHEFEIIDPFDWNDFAKLLGDFIEENYDEFIEVTGYTHQFELQAGGKIYSAYEPELSLEFTNNSYAGWIDLDKYAKFEHNTILYNYDLETEQFYTIEANWYPVIEDADGETYFTDDILLYGEEVEISGEEPETVTEEVTGDPKDSVCALLVSGKDERSERMQNSFEHDLELVKNNLQHEKLGPQLHESNIRVENGITEAELYGILQSMKGKYSKIYFYYSGHGTSNFMCTGDSVSEWTYYPTLMEKLSEIGAEDYCIIVDACESGGAKNALDSTIYFEDANVTLVTSSNDEKSSYTNYAGTTENPIGFGLYTLHFLTCFGEPSAESDGMEGISFVEAFNWVKEQKPKSSSGRDLDSLQCPTITVKSNGDKDEESEEVTFENADIKFTNAEGAELEFDYKVSMSIDLKDYEWNDENIIDLSGSRTWKIDASGISDDFSVDIEFQLRDQYEILTPTGENILGMCWREDNEDEWKPQYPSVHNEDDNTILCADTDHFSEWAVGVIVGSPASVDSKFLINNVEYGPNPFKNILNFEFNLDTPQSFAIEIVDVTGNVYDRINERSYGTGTYNVNLDGSKYPTGSYYCRLISDNGVRTIKLVKE